jgi:hypothetical protein
MRRLLRVVLSVLLGAGLSSGLMPLARPAHGQGTVPGFNRPLQPYAFERLLIDATPGGVALTALLVTPATGRGADYIRATVEGGLIRCRVDGTAPVPGVGEPYRDGTRLVIIGNEAALKLRCIQDGATGAALSVSYYRAAL